MTARTPKPPEAAAEPASAEAKNEALGTLAHGIAHDFSNLLAIISGYSEVTRDALASAGLPLDDVAQISAAARRGKELVARLLAAVDAHAPPVASSSSPEAPRQTPTPGAMLLIVDDDDQVRDVTRRLAQRLGHSVLLARSGEEALEIHREKRHQIDVVLLDLGMPGMGGARCLEALLARDPGLRVIISTGEDGEALVQGAVGRLKKPFSGSELDAAVNAAIPH